MDGNARADAWLAEVKADQDCLEAIRKGNPEEIDRTRREFVAATVARRLASAA